jgi:hypothetical protein
MIATFAASFYGKSPLWLRHKIPKKNTDDNHNSSIQKKTKTKTKKQNKTQLNSTQLNSELHRSKGAILQHCCIGWLQNSYECVEKNHLLPSPDILLALCVGSIFVCWSGWVGCDFFFLFFSSLFSLNSV